MNIRRYFTWEEASALVPKLSEIFGTVRQLRTRLRSLYSELEAAGAAPTPENLLLPGPPDVTRLRAIFRGLYDALAEQLRTVEDLGALVKDIDMGLVDFLARKDGKDILLCWRYGEKEIAYWHELHTGFSGRKPILPHERTQRGTIH